MVVCSFETYTNMLMFVLNAKLVGLLMGQLQFHKKCGVIFL
jgi:hypothetical protein